MPDCLGTIRNVGYFITLQSLHLFWTNYCCCLPLLRVNQLTTYYGCMSLFCHLKMCVSSGFLEFKGLVMSRRWVRLSRERWAVIMNFDMLEMLLSEWELGYHFCWGQGSREGLQLILRKRSKQMEQRERSHMNIVFGMYSDIHDLIGLSSPYWKVYYFMVPDLCLFQREQTLSLQSHLLCKRL